jgi:hypothetical protein
MVNKVPKKTKKKSKKLACLVMAVAFNDGLFWQILENLWTPKIFSHVFNVKNLKEKLQSGHYSLNKNWCPKTLATQRSP